MDWLASIWGGIKNVGSSIWGGIKAGASWAKENADLVKGAGSLLTGGVSMYMSMEQSRMFENMMSDISKQSQGYDMKQVSFDEYSASDVQAAADEKKRRLLAQTSSTILTGGLGITEAPNLKYKTLLGG